jgi:D-ribose pyranose/furanose isomerase RbsD
VLHASLPDGGTVTVWVGVPQDSYLAPKDVTNVDLQLREGDQVLATVTTVLDPDQEAEAHALAREVQSALETGEAALTAAALEPFADRLR